MGSILVFGSPTIIVISCSKKEKESPFFDAPINVIPAITLPGITKSAALSTDNNQNIYFQQQFSSSSIHNKEVYRGLIDQKKFTINKSYDHVSSADTLWTDKQNIHILEIGSVLNKPKPNFGIFSPTRVWLLQDSGALAFGGTNLSELTTGQYNTAAIIDKIGSGGTPRISERAGKPGILAYNKENGKFDYINGYQASEGNQTCLGYQTQSLSVDTQVNTAFTLPIFNAKSSDYHFAYFIGTNHGLYRLYNFTASTKNNLIFQPVDTDKIKNVNSYQIMHDKLYLFDQKDEMIDVINDLNTAKQVDPGQPPSLYPMIINLSAVKNNPLGTITNFNISADPNNNLFIGAQGYTPGSTILTSALFYYNNSERSVNLVTSNYFIGASNIVPEFIDSNNNFALFSVAKNWNITDLFTQYPGPQMSFTNVTKVFPDGPVLLSVNNFLNLTSDANCCTDRGNYTVNIKVKFKTQ